MSVLVVGVSHRTASLSLLERVSLDDEQLHKLLTDTRSRPHLTEAVVVATCNRVEVYAEADRFHGGIEDIADLLATHTGVPEQELTPHLFARYEQGAIAHLFGLACGLDSMVVGETQILGQVRAALRTAQEVGTAGSALNGLFQRALHVGKRAHSETALGEAGRSLVGATLQEVGSVLGGLDGRRALVLGAGSMAALAATVLRRDHDADVVIANRTPERAARLAGELGARTTSLDGPDGADALLSQVDLVVSCTGANQVVLGYDRLRRALSDQPLADGALADLADRGDLSDLGDLADRERTDGSSPRPLVVADLAMPRDVDDAVAALPGVTLINLDGLSVRLSGGENEADEKRTGRSDQATDQPGDQPGGQPDGQPVDQAADLRDVRGIVSAEVEAYVLSRQAAAAAPTVVALRDMAADVVGSELERLSGRLSGMDESAYAEVEKTVRRVVDKLLHVPTVRVKELGEEPVQTSYADALRELFALEPSTAALLEDPPPQHDPPHPHSPSGLDATDSDDRKW